MIKTQDYIRELVTIFFIQRKVIVFVTSLCLLGAVGVAFLWPPVYESNGSILVKRMQPLKSPESVEDVNPEMIQVREDDLMSEMQIIIANSVVKKTVAELQKNNDPYYNNYSSKNGANKLSLAIKDNLSTELIPKTNVINVRLTWQDPQRAKEILQSYFQEYLDYRSELYNPKGAYSFFQKQINNYNKELKKREDDLIEIAKNNNLSSPQDQIKSNLLIQENLIKQVTDLKTRQTEKKHYIDQIKRSIQSHDINFFTSVENLEIGDMGGKIQDLMLKKNELLEVYTKQSSKVQRVEDMIQKAYGALKSEVQRYIDVQVAQLHGINENLNSLNDRIKQFDKRNFELYQKMIETNRINREVDILNTSYNTFAKRLQEAQISTQTKTDRLFRVNILSQPSTSAISVFPNKMEIIPLGLLLGFILGSTLGFLLEFFDHSFKRPEDVYNFTNLPNVFSIPEW